jgi:hypothetical protein
MPWWGGRQVLMILAMSWVASVTMSRALFWSPEVHLLQNVAIGLLDEHVGYGDPRGNARLREVLCGWLATTRGVRTDPDGIIVVAGQRAIAVEDPGSRGARDELAHWGLQ